MYIFRRQYYFVLQNNSFTQQKSGKHQKKDAAGSILSYFGESQPPNPSPRSLLTLEFKFHFSTPAAPLI